MSKYSNDCFFLEKFMLKYTWSSCCLCDINIRLVFPRIFFFGNSKLKPYSFNLLFKSTNSRKRFVIIHEDDGSFDIRVTRIEYS
jgi:diphthamide synthase subunit DPH2